MSILYIVSDKQGAGKTALCAALAQLLRAHGKRATAFKPVSHGAHDDDPALYQTLLATDAPAPCDADALSQIANAASRLAAQNDVVIAEASRSLAPDQSRRIADALDARVIALATFAPDLTPDAVLALGAPYADRLVGYVVNNLTLYMQTHAQANLIPGITASGAPLLALLPEDRRLLGVSVAQLADRLSGEFILDEGDPDDLVEYLMVGGMSLDPGETYFATRDNRAAIVRGDRPDLQMSALGAPGNTACIIATGGIQPIEYVRYEAEQEETPIIIVQTDTLDTMDALNALIDSSRFDHPRKLERFTSLLTRHLDIETLLAAITP